MVRFIENFRMVIGATLLGVFCYGAAYLFLQGFGQNGTPPGF